MFSLSEIKLPIIVVTILMMVAIPVFVEAGHGGMGGGMSGGMGGCCGSSYYGSYYPTTTASWLGGGYSPYATVLSPYGSTARLGNVLGSSYYGLGGLGLGGYGLYGAGLGGYGLYGAGLGGYGLYGAGLGGYGLYGAGLGGYGYGYPYSGGAVTSTDYGVEQSYTQWVPGGAVTTSYSQNQTVSPLNYGWGGYGAYPYYGGGW